ncbi:MULTISPECIES: DUF4829 domain-containing protein [Clostridium]|uniref:DUF4829 domain-containing protein n=1 Tax=Clostridium sporogenes TaxID=1509 RepID=A0A7X5SYL6_CLOSG|nr:MULTISPECIES: DUF4829 domain-containing protein [Clostridium]AJD30190.1 hypothetical protein T258_3505 [Clostridium botulinum Prevot_594]KRU41444.1 hypothetical protein VT94_19090 [Clostridium sporogenes]MBE6057215.1 DUF4829 domain-containing protein [Clostridium sp.]MBY7013986.1 DUF4829 domain-containing protein [Clostridium sporogenes]MBY7063146.1 DUF4829 domain-containing protein [Clostridium sporogenes]
MNKKMLIPVILICLCLCIGYFKERPYNTEKQLLESKRVVENYFKYYNEKNKEKILTTLTEVHDGPNVVWGFKNLEYINLNSIKEEKDPKQKEAYMKYGRGTINGVKEDNVIIYKVNYKVKYKKDEIEPQDSGSYETWFTLIRKDKNSPWLIDEVGEG